MQTAQEEKADLIMMPSHSFTFYQFLLGSVTAKVLHGTECPVWTGAHVQESPVQKFAIRNVLCAVEFGPRADITVSWAAQMAAEFGAHLTLANVTAGVELWGPGGSYVDQRWKEELVGNASQQMAKLQQDTGIKADVFIGSGDVPNGAEPSCEADEGGFAGYRVLPLWRSPADPRLRNHLRGADSGSERVRAERSYDKPAITVMLCWHPRLFHIQHIGRSAILAPPAEIVRVRQAVPLPFATHEGDSWLASVCCFDQGCEQY